MRKSSLFFSLFTLALISNISFAQDCNRSCLEQFLTQYLDAIVAHDPLAAPLSHGFRQTENAISTPQGAGVWESINELGELQRRYIDTSASTAGYFGLLSEDDGPAVASLRLKISQGKITEAEWHIGRATDVGLQGNPGKVAFDAENLIENPPQQGIVPANKRYDRDDLIAVANSYFDGITHSDSRLIKGKPGCSRLENGLPTYGIPLTEGQIGFNGLWDCRTQGDFGLALVASRRVQLVDVEQQAVMLSAVFIREPENTQRRNHFTEVFSIEEGLIKSVHAAMFYPKPTQPVPNWPPYSGTFPLSLPEE